MAYIQREDCVGYVSAIISRIGEARARSATLRETIRTAQQQLNLAEEASHIANKELFEELKRMDLTSSGNYGWEARLVNFLVELRDLK